MVSYLRDVVFNLLGQYVPQTFFDPNTGDLVAVHPDVEYIVSAILFILAFYSLFRIIGSLCSKI